MAVYTTTKCKNCGYHTRTHENSVPKVQIGAPIFPCPNCGNLILDSIIAEYEFMTDRERANFGSTVANIKSYPFNILAILMGIFFFVVGITADSLTVISIIVAIVCVALGVSNIIDNSKAVDEKLMEQAIYESLQRTKNLEYVKYIEATYAANKIKRTYRPYIDRQAFVEQYKYMESRKSYIENMESFDDLIKCLGIEYTDSAKFDSNISITFENTPSTKSKNYGVNIDESLEKVNLSASANEDAQKTQSVNFCRKCGNKVTEDSVFCNKCGSKINWN